MNQMILKKIFFSLLVFVYFSQSSFADETENIPKVFTYSEPITLRNSDEIFYFIGEATKDQKKSMSSKTSLTSDSSESSPSAFYRQKLLPYYVVKYNIAFYQFQVRASHIRICKVANNDCKIITNLGGTITSLFVPVNKYGYAKNLNEASEPETKSPANFFLLETEYSDKEKGIQKVLHITDLKNVKIRLTPQNTSFTFFKIDEFNPYIYFGTIEDKNKDGKFDLTNDRETVFKVNYNKPNVVIEILTESELMDIVK
ncbi:MAG: hypothetical protein SFU98_06000 [Leptospiraceae bacterium]|nr:hypothetical protein [Leptospiraceae bacterium]